ncbi:MAG: ATP synthase F1 subunit epsilon [Phycisphaerae bacterium]|nr:ATP synthase F1 subunit epsilon [Phycisphaerae bacterium]
MAKDKLFSCSVITPERIVLECEASFAAFTAHDGELGIMLHRAPLLCRLGIGTIRVDTPSGREEFFIDSGFAQMLDNRLTVLTEQARKPSAIDTAAAQQALTDAKALEVTDDASFEARQRAVRRAKVQIALAGKR